MREEYQMAEKLLSGSGSGKQFAAQQLLALMNEMPGGFFIYRADGNEDLLYANTALLRIFGCETFAELCALTGGSFRGLVHPDDLDAIEESIWHQIKNSQFDLDYVEYRITRKDGRIRWLEDHGHFIHSNGLGDIFYVFVADATEKKRRHEGERTALRTENERKEQRIQEYDKEVSRRQELIAGLGVDYESIFYADLSIDLIHAYRLSRHAGLLFINDPPSRDYSGFVEEYIKRWVHPEDRQLITDMLDPARIRERLAGSPVLHVNYRLLRDFRTEYLQLRIVSVCGGPEISQIVIGARSVDEEIRSALEQKEFLANALEQAKSAVIAKNTFLSNMSHDMRTPLNAIVGFTELARRNIDEKEKSLRYLEMINVASSQLLRLISNVLEIARIESGSVTLNRGTCDLREISERVRKALLPRADAKNLILSLHTEQLRQPFIYSDRHKLEEILFHLSSNAVKYTELGGRVDITLSSENNVVRMTVEDNGIGISRGFLSHIFEFFAREHNTTLSGVHGTGLGLPIVKSLTELLNGTIDVQSEPGKGSRFTVTLPVRPQDARPLSPAPIQPEKLPRGEGKILVVEDNELNLEIAMDLLRDAGFTAEAATDGSIAVEKIRNAKPGEYALILMDIQMPVMDGCTAAWTIRCLPDPYLSSIPIVALSANAFEEDKKRAIESGMAAHLSKPIDIDSLVELINKLTNAEPQAE